MRSLALLWTLSFAWAGVGCGDDDLMTGDAGPRDTFEGVDAGSDAFENDAGPGIEAPAAPLPPSWTCRDGWTTRVVEGVSICEPAGTATICPAGEARFPADTGCQPIDTCEERAIPDDAVFVSPGGTGAGTRADPTHLIAALDLRPQRPIALGAGRYEGPFVISDDSTLIGTCTAETVLTAAPGQEFVVYVTGRAALSHLSVEPSGNVGVAVTGALTMSSVAVSDPSGAGVVVVRGSLDAERLVIRGTNPRANEGGMGLLVQGGIVRGREWFISDNSVAGIYVQDGELIAEDVVSVASRIVEPRISAPALIQFAGTVSIDGADFRDATHIAINLVDGDLTLRSLRVDPTIATAPSTDMLFLNEGSVTIDGAFVEGRGVVFSARNLQTFVLRDALVMPNSSEFEFREHMAFGLVNSPADIERVVVVGGDQGMIAQGPFDFSIPLPGEPVPPTPDPEPVLLTVRDLAFHSVGETVSNTATLTIDSPIHGTLDRVSIRDARSVALATSSADLTIRDLSVSAMQPSSGGYGAAVLISGGGLIDVERMSIEGTKDIALQLTSSALQARHVSIRDARERECSSEDARCRMSPGGVGLGIYSDSTLDLRNFEIEGVDLCALQVARGGTAMLQDGRIARAEIGACIQTEGFDVMAITDGVAYEDNGTNIENTEHAIPDVPAPPGL